MVGGQLDAPNETRFGTGARERLRKLIEVTLQAGDFDEAERTADVREREEMAAIRAALPVVEVVDGVLAAVAPPPQPIESDVERMNRVNAANAPPRYYLQNYDEPAAQ